MYNENNIEETISNVKKSVADIINGMEPKSRMITKDFVGRVISENYAINAVVATGLTYLCIKNNNEVYQRSGKFGGIFKKEIRND